MGLKLLLYLLIILIAVFQVFFTSIPIGNERTRAKRAPIITMIIIGLNLLVFVATLKPIEDEDERLVSSGMHLLSFCAENSSLLLFEDIQKKLKDADLLSDGTLTTATQRFRIEAPNDQRALRQLGEESATRLHAEFDTLLNHYQDDKNSHIFFRFGLAGNGRWKPYQLLTSMFLHGGFEHILGNMIFFAALAISLEALWGRTVFLLFYILVGVAAAVPQLIVPATVPSIGASGAISGIMGAFLVSLHKTKLKVAWVSLPLLVLMPLWIAIFGFKKKPFGIMRIPAYVYLPYFFLCELLLWWAFKEAKVTSGVAHSVHVGGFFFGVFFAMILEYANFKTNFFGLDYSESLVSAELRELNEGNQFGLAEQKVIAFIQKHPDDIEAQVALAQVSQKMGRYDQMNEAYSRIIRHHLANGDKHAALLAYDGLLSGFPENQIRPKIQVNDWMTICDYLHKEGMTREAAVEYERLANASQDSPLALRACVQGGEAALSVNDRERALRMFELALSLRPSPSHEPRIRRGIERCNLQPAQP